MSISRPDYGDLNYFLTVARYRSFSRAGVELSVSSSTLSHALKSFEERLGVRLLNRTTRSVTLTAAGQQLLEAISEPLGALDEAIEGLNRFRESPAGLVRLNVMQDAALYLLSPVMPVLAERYPDVQIDIAINNRMIDVVGEGFDAGIRYGGTVPEDMVTQALSAPIAWVVVGSPDYLRRHGEPQHPNDLQQHRCIGIRLGSGRIYQWEFERGGESLNVSVPSAITIDDGPIALSLVEKGVGLVYATEPSVAALVESGKLRYVLQDWRSFGPSFHIYYSSRRQLPVGLRLLIDLIREIRPLGL
ncbi:MAG: LysR family transcriptional regulator [Steroidobacteraceae bacterium]|nr:LysR family transcriptional regulator [Pseudomonadales bacterium]MCP5472349.1 LysR family transcriptional regulator [Nevskiaceae bacterium]